MPRATKHEDLERELLSDPETKREADALAWMTDLARLRMARGWSDEDLAGCSSLRLRTVRSLLMGEAGCQIGCLSALAQALGAQVRVLPIERLAQESEP